jgi:hypothetical protein
VASVSRAASSPSGSSVVTRFSSGGRSGGSGRIASKSSTASGKGSLSVGVAPDRRAAAVRRFQFRSPGLRALVGSWTNPHQDASGPSSTADAAETLASWTFDPTRSGSLLTTERSRSISRHRSELRCSRCAPRGLLHRNPFEDRWRANLSSATECPGHGHLRVQPIAGFDTCLSPIAALG